MKQTVRRRAAPGAGPATDAEEAPGRPSGPPKGEGQGESSPEARRRSAGADIAQGGRGESGGRETSGRGAKGRGQWGRADLGLVAAGLCGLAALAVLGRARGRRGRAAATPPARKIRQGAALLGASVLADSGLEHFRGGFGNAAMYAAPVLGANAVLSSLSAPDRRPARAAKTAGHLSNVAFGGVGLGFHLYNILKRPGGLSWNNLFYAAPIGAPGALLVAGVLNLAADRVDRILCDPPGRRDGPAPGGAARWLPGEGRQVGRGMAALAGATLLVETAEVALLHFRGSFQNPAMFAPVTVPPLAALALLSQAARPDPRRADVARALAQATGALGVIGTGFHIYGVHRNMGGWGNWRQNVLAGPPLPAPISFTGLALAGIAALDLLDPAQDGAERRPGRRARDRAAKHRDLSGPERATDHPDEGPPPRPRRAAQPEVAKGPRDAPHANASQDRGEVRP